MRNRALRTQLILGPCDQVTDPRERRDAFDQLVPDRAERFLARSIPARVPSSRANAAASSNSASIERSATVSTAICVISSARSS